MTSVPQTTRPTLSGCTFIRNGAILGFPFIESIQSILPIVDEFIVVVGRGTDETLERIRAIGSKKIKIIETVWNEKMAERGFVYAQQKMISQYACTSDWVFYLEGDEVVHEQDHDAIETALTRHHANPVVEALVFDYFHFYGSPQWLAISPRWYRRECRIIRNTIRSYAPDGQYWVVMDQNRRGRHPKAALAGVPIYHYGHVRKIEMMQLKAEQVSKYWSHAAPKMNYDQVDPKSLKSFDGTHPELIKDWLQNHAELSFTPQPVRFKDLSNRDKKHRVSMMLEKILGIDLSRKHYQLISE